MSEAVLCIRRGYWPKHGTSITAISKPDIVNSWTVRYYDRSRTENDKFYVQVIPYIVVHDEAHRIALYQRGTESEKRLFPFKSIGFGGHVNPIDKRATLLQTLFIAAKRELQEEIERDLKWTIRGPHYTIRSAVDEVSLAHIGLVYTASAPGIADQEGPMEWKTLEELKAEKGLEEWSQAVIRALEVMTSKDTFWVTCRT